MILNTFPNLLTFGIIAPFILRVVLALIAVNLGWLKLGKENLEWKELFENDPFPSSSVFCKILCSR